eukprot:symbB.v1.2.016767.t1/scaffold1288.1/size126514/8
MVLWLVPNISGSGSDGGPVMQLTHRDGTAISVSYAVNRAVLWREDFHQTSPVQWQPDNSWKNGYLQRRIHFLLRWHDLSSVMENWDPFSEGPASAEDGQAMENWNPFEDPEMLELTGELAMESDDIDGLEAWLVQAKVMHLPWEKIQPKQEKLELLRSQKVKSPAVNLEAARETEEIKAVAQQKLLRKSRSILFVVQRLLCLYCGGPTFPLTADKPCHFRMHGPQP